jgi:FKBP-type peptidyl-prolyl cis-trans isomerase (trigger factor)
VGKTQEEFLEEMRPSANERLTRYLVMRKLSQAEEIEVSDEEVQEEIDSAVESAGESAEAMRRALASEAALDNIRSSILNRKIMQRLVEIVQPETGEDQDDQPAPTDDAAAASAEDVAAESDDAPSGEEETKEQPIADQPEASIEASIL